MTKEKIKQTTHVAIVLDHSGSMGGISEMARTTFNEQVQTLKSITSRGHETLLTAVLFNHEAEVLYSSVPIKKVKELESYTADGTTALYDATWKAIDLVQTGMPKRKSRDAALVVVISDGYENASRSVTGPQLASRISELEATKQWTFSYAAGSPNLAQAQNLAQYAATSTGLGGLSGSTCMVQSFQGMASFSSSLASVVGAYYTQRNMGVQQVVNFMVNPTKSV